MAILVSGEIHTSLFEALKIFTELVGRSQALLIYERQNSLHSCLVTRSHWEAAGNWQLAFAHLYSSNVVRMSVLSSALTT